MVRRRVRSKPYAARNSRLLHCVAAGGDGVTAVHVDGGLHAVLSGAVIAGAAKPVGRSAHAVWCYYNQLVMIISELIFDQSLMDDTVVR